MAQMQGRGLVTRKAGCWARLFGMCLLAMLSFASVAAATPTFLSPVNISPAGEDGFEPDVAVDPSGNVLAVWTRSDGANTRIQFATRTATSAWSAAQDISASGQNASDGNVAIDPSGNALVAWSRSDGTNIRIQAAFRPAGGSFASPVTVSDAGFDATKPEVDFDASGKALITWQRFDGSKLRVQATTRTAGAAGVFANETTLSEGGEDAFEPKAEAGPDVDANAAIVWTRSDGTKLRVQSARRRDVTGFARPKGATPSRVALVPAYNSCASPNRTHGPSLASPSCAPPVRSSSVLTVGTPDANTFAANSVGFVKADVITGDANTTADEADVALLVSITDVRNNPSGTDYTGRLLVTSSLRITDNANSDERPDPATLQAITLQFPVQCAATGDTAIGGLCTVTTTYDAVVPGAVQERQRAIWELGQIQVKDAGPNGTGYASCPPTCGDGDETVFMRQGVFIP
jgi:hypothetical protein